MRARRTDSNNDEIAKAAEALGVRVHRTNREWDQTWQYGGLTMLVEVKDGSKPPSARKLTKAEEITHSKMTIRIIKDLSDVKGAVDVLRRWHRVLCRELPKQAI